ncbi:MAG: rRNA pseudouridine synthase [Oscillospiraceae bacterium]|nr:rRNA pseudouridine synthase [Oscillospiraceae bacterium]
MEEARLQKIIADSGYCSRRQAEALIADGKVKVNGRPAQVGQKAVPGKDIITVDGERIASPKKKQNIYLMLYKPRGYLTAMSDDRGRKCVTELVADLEERVYPVGRLDLNSEGMLLFTNDGDFANAMMHPSHQIPKTYRVTVREKVTEEHQISLSTGVEIDGYMTSPATVRVVTEEDNRTVLLITITEGRNRQIRKMCEAVGLTVARLKRISIGSLRMGMLQPGEYRMLTKEEVDALYETARRKGGQPTAKESASRAKPRSASFGRQQRRGR